MGSKAASSPLPASRSRRFIAALLGLGEHPPPFPSVSSLDLDRRFSPVGVDASPAARMQTAQSPQAMFLPWWVGSPPPPPSRSQPETFFRGGAAAAKLSGPTGCRRSPCSRYLPLSSSSSSSFRSADGVVSGSVQDAEKGPTAPPSFPLVDHGYLDFAPYGTQIQVDFIFFPTSIFCSV